MLDYDWYMSSSFPTLIRLWLITHNVVPPSYKFVYKHHEYYSYLRTINHSYWSYLHQLNYRSGAPLCSVHLIKPVERGWHRGFMWLQSHQEWWRPGMVRLRRFTQLPTGAFYAGNFREWSISSLSIIIPATPSNPQQPIHSLRLSPVRYSQWSIAIRKYGRNMGQSLDIWEYVWHKLLFESTMVESHIDHITTKVPIKR